MVVKKPDDSRGTLVVVTRSHSTPKQGTVYAQSKTGELRDVCGKEACLKA